MDVIHIKDMKRWLHMAVLATIVALLANNQCYARCLASVNIASSAEQHSTCHQSSHSPQGNHSRCDYDRHSETATVVEARAHIDQIPVFYSAPAEFVPVSISGFGLQSSTPRLPILPERAFPPHKPLFLAISVFRL